MNLRHYSILGSFTTMAMGGWLVASTPANAQSSTVSVEQEGEVLTRGPVHEAFAGTVSYDPVQGILVSAKPPEAIEEIPPEQQPEGDNVVWIPGYWAWDEDQNDFLWVSGIWRNLPPGRQWVPGYWSEAQGQYQWTSGYWADTENTEVTYLPEPPRSVETGPNITAPSDNYTWIPGNWMWRESRYAWRSGYWTERRPNWIYQPACYRWTYRGYVYVDGYWDYPVASRGLLFAPVYFGHDVYSRPGFCYSPRTVISLSVFTDYLFLRPIYGHYYFGDYYAPRYRDSGYYASYSYNSGRRGCDPIYAYQSWENRGDRNWQQNRRSDYEYRRDHEEARPPRTWAALGSRTQIDPASRRSFDLAQPLDRLVANRGDGRQRFKTLDQPTRERFVAQRQEVRKFAQERQQLETRGERPQLGGSPDRTKLTRSPIAARASMNPSRGDAPPKRLERSLPEQARQERGKSAEKASVVPRPEPGIRPEANRNPEPPSTGKSTPRSDRQMVPQPERKMQPGPNRDAVSPSRETKSPTAVPRPGSTGETAASRQSQPRHSVPQPSRQTQPEAKRQAVSPAPNTPRQEAARPPAPRQIRPEAPAAKRPEPAPRQQAEQPRRAEPPQQRVQPPQQRVQPPQQRVQPPQQRVQPPQQRVQPPQQRVQPQQQRVQPPQQRVQPQQQRVQPQRQQASQRQQSQPSRQVAPAPPQRQQSQPAPRPQARRSQPAPQRAQAPPSAPQQNQQPSAPRSKTDEERRGRNPKAI